MLYKNRLSNFELMRNYTIQKYGIKHSTPANDPRVVKIKTQRFYFRKMKLCVVSDRKRIYVFKKRGSVLKPFFILLSFNSWVNIIHQF